MIAARKQAVALTTNFKHITLFQFTAPSTEL